MQIKRSERQERANEKALATINMIKKAVEDANGDLSVLNNLGPLLGCSEQLAQCRLARYITYLYENNAKKYLIGEVAKFKMKVYKTGLYEYLITDYGPEWSFVVTRLMELLGIRDNILGITVQNERYPEPSHVNVMSVYIPREVRGLLQPIYTKTFSAYKAAVSEVEDIKKQIDSLKFRLNVASDTRDNLALLLDNEADLLKAATKSYLA